MTRGKKRRYKNQNKDKDDKKPPVPKSDEEKRFFKRISMFWSVVGVFSVIIGLAASYLAFVPKVSISIGNQVFPNDPLSTPFIVSNENPFPLYSVRAHCSIESLIGATVPVDFEGKKVPVQLNSVGSEYTPEIDLTSGEKFTLGCSGKKQNNPDIDFSHLESAEVIITVKFKPFWIFWTQTKYFRFGTLPTSDGKLSLVPMPNKAPTTDIN